MQKREKRRLLEAPADAWKRWDALAKIEGLSWAEFARRALLQRTSSIQELVDWANESGRTPSERATMLERLPGLQLSEKPTAKKRISTRAKKRLRATAARKGSSRS